jgi:hypothetical protein
MPGWLKLDPRKLERERKEEVSGARVVVFLSPYDTPEAVRGFFDKALNRFVIQFKYLGCSEEPDEPLDTESHDQHICLRVGRHSHRLYKVEIDVEQLGVSAVGLDVLQQVDDAIDWLDSERRRPSNRGRYGVTKQAISDRKDDLLSELVPA